MQEGARILRRGEDPCRGRSGETCRGRGPCRGSGRDRSGRPDRGRVFAQGDKMHWTHRPMGGRVGEALDVRSARPRVG